VLSHLVEASPLVTALRSGGESRRSVRTHTTPGVIAAVRRLFNDVNADMVSSVRILRICIFRVIAAVRRLFNDVNADMVRICIVFGF
jgi:hypothetical protein